MPAAAAMSSTVVASKPRSANSSRATSSSSSRVVAGGRPCRAGTWSGSTALLSTGPRTSSSAPGGAKSPVAVTVPCDAGHHRSRGGCMDTDTAVAHGRPSTTVRRPHCDREAPRSRRRGGPARGGSLHRRHVRRLLADVRSRQRPYRCSPQVAVRPEPFGALLYHFGTRRLSFLKDQAAARRRCQRWPSTPTSTRLWTLVAVAPATARRLPARPGRTGRRRHDPEQRVSRR